MDILTILFFILFIITVPLGELIRIPVGMNGTLLPLDVIVFLIAIWGCISLFLRPKKPRFLKEILLFSCIALISLLLNMVTLTSSQLLSAGLYLLRWVSYAGVYLVVVPANGRVKRVLPWFMGSAMGILALIGIAQFFLYPNLRNLAYLGWDVHLYRLFSTFLDPNFAGAFLSLGFFLGIAALLRVKLVLWKKIGVWCLLAVLLSAISLTYSRSAYAMVLVGTLTILMVSNFKKAALIISLGTICFLVIIILFIKPRSEGTNLLRTTSSVARVATAQTAYDIFLHSPLYGVGFNAYRYAQVRFGFLSEKDIVDSHAAAGTDNSFLFVLATTGILGLCAYLWLYGKMFSYALKNRTNVYALALVGSFIGVGVSAFFINSLFYPFILIWLWVLSGLIENTLP